MCKYLYVCVFQDIKGQVWTDEDSDGENEPEQFLYGIQVKHWWNVLYALISQNILIIKLKGWFKYSILSYFNIPDLISFQVIQITPVNVFWNETENHFLYATCR